MKRTWKDIIAILILTSIIGAYFFRLFYPEPKLIVTPDFGRSDAWHFSFSTKVSLSRALKENSLPLWEPLIGGGFPLFAEGQVGALFPSNLLLFRLFSPVLAYNIALVVAFIMLAWGMYLYLRILKRSIWGAAFGALVLSFSGLPVLQLPHITLLQGFSLMPLILWAGFRGNPWLLAVLLAFQIFAGFPQATFLTLITVYFQSVYLSFRQRSAKPLTSLLIGTFLGVGMGAAQLLPSYEFLTQIGGSKGFDYFTASYFSFPPSHIVTFLSPFALGNPKLGTYAPFYRASGSIFWENTAYMGIIPLVLAFGYIVFIRSSWKTFWLTTFGGSLVLALGKYAPTYLLFALWPFTLFRVPSRFLWITSLALSVMSSFGFDAMPRKRWLRIAVLIFSVTQLVLTWRHYHLFGAAETWTTKGALVTSLPQDARILTPDVGIRYTKAFEKGWVDPTPYEKLRVVPMPDSNIISRVASLQAYAGRFLWRNTITESLILSTMDVGEHETTISAAAKKNLSLYGVTSIILTDPVRITDNPDAVSRFRLVSQASAAATVKETTAVIQNSGFNPKISTVLASHDVASNTKLSEITHRARTNGQEGRITMVMDTPIRSVLSVEGGNQSSILVSTDSYYPGWKALVDGEQTTIYPANISQRAIVIPPGDHTVEFVYEPQSLRLGSVISIISVLLITGLAGYRRFAEVFRTAKITRRHSFDHPHNRKG